MDSKRIKMSFLTSDQIDIIIHNKLIPLQTKIKYLISLSSDKSYAVSPKILKEILLELEEIKNALMNGDIEI